jgi:flagella basal body P-ring formation protein FlgA
VDPARIREAIRAEWNRIAPDNATLEIRAVPSLRCRSESSVLEARLIGDPGRPGPRAVPVACRVGERTAVRGLASVLVRVRLPVRVTTRPLRRGEELEPTALRVEERIFDRMPRRLFHPEAGRRWRAARDVSAGAPLRRTDVRPVPDVEAGSPILLVARAGSASAAVPGRVRRGGDVGDVVRVHNPVTGVIVKAKLVDRSTAVVLGPVSAIRDRKRGES